jgi:hypothetical protein
MKSPLSLLKPKKPRFYIRQITGDSMLPLYKPGHIAVVVPHKEPVKIGDVVMVNHGGLQKIKRITASKDSRVFVEGDNQAYSTDSRAFGWLHQSAVLGKVVWPRKIEEREIPWLVLRGIGVAGTVALLALFFMFPSWPTPDKLLVFLTFIFMSFGQAWQMLKRLLPFGALLLVYESFRGIVPHINHRVNFTWMIDMDKLMFGGVLPTVRLQELFWNGSLRWYDFVFYMTYMLHFILPLGLAILVWKLRPWHYWRVVSAYVAVSFAGFITFMAFPAAPPWMASDLGYMADIHRVSSDVYAAMGLGSTVSVYNGIAPNPVAAVPSLHAAYATIFTVVIWMLFGKKWGLLTLIYPLIIYVGTVYSGEHYVVDEVLGVFYGVAAVLGVYMFRAHKLKDTKQKDRAAHDEQHPAIPLDR